MIRYYLTFILISFGLVSRAQIKDTTFLRAEFIYGIDELNQLTSYLQTFPSERGSFVSAIEKATIPSKIVLSPQGIIESVSITGFISIEYRWARREFSEDYYKKYCAYQIKAICKFTEGLWIPAESNMKPVYDTIYHDFVLKWKNKRNSKYAFEQSSDVLNFFFTPKLDMEFEFSSNPFFLLYNSKPQKNSHVETSSVMFYNFALEKMNEKKFFIAEKMFRLAYLKNQNNDCLFNLAISQLNLGWNKDACLNLNKLSNNGDKEALNLIQQYCK